MFDFPSSPATGQTATTPGGSVYTWDGTKWVSTAASSTTYAPLASPAFTGNPTAPTPTYGDNDTSIPTTAFVQSAVTPAFNDIGRNLLHNPLFNVQQRGAGPWTASGYTLDRWFAGIVTDTATFQSSTLSDAARAQIGDEAAIYSFQGAVTGTTNGTTWYDQKIESVRRLAGKTVTVSFWAIASSGTPKLGANIYQSFGTGGSPSTGVWAQATGNAVTLSTTWTRYSMAFTIPSASGKTFGTTAGTDFTGLRFYLSAGSGNSDYVPSGNIGAQSTTIAMWGMQCEIGTQATPLEKPDPGDDLRRAQRFYQTGYFQYSGSGTNTFSTAVSQKFPTTMRATPTITTSGVTATNISGQSVTAVSGIDYYIAWTATATGPCYYYGNFTASADL